MLLLRHFLCDTNAAIAVGADSVDARRVQCVKPVTFDQCILIEKVVAVIGCTQKKFVFIFFANI